MEMMNMASLVKQIRGVSYKPDDLRDKLDDTSVILLRANNIDGGRINFDDVVYVDRGKVSDEQLLQKGDILICASSGSKAVVGKAATVAFDGDATFGAFCKVVRPLKPQDADFLSMYFQSSVYRRKISSVALGANINNIRNEHINALSVRWPVASARQEIVVALSKIDSIVRRQKEEMQKLDDLVKARFVEMFRTNTPKRVAIADLVVARIPSARKDFAESDKIKYIDISSVDNQLNQIKGCAEYLMSAAPSRAQQHIEKGDILISTVRPNLKNVAVVTSDDKNLVASSGFCVLRAEKCLPSYLMAIACSDEFTEAMSRKVTGANYPAIKDSDVMGYLVAVPSMEKQREFEAFVAQVDKSKSVVQKSLEETQLLFDSLMQKYFG